MQKIINKGIDILAALLIIGIISFFLVGGPKAGNLSEVTTTKVESTTKVSVEHVDEVITDITSESIAEPVTEITTEIVKETTTKVVEETTKKEVVSVKVTAPKVRTKSASQFSDEEIYLFAQILYCEAGGASKNEMARVGQVVLNRMYTDYWEFEDVNTFYEVLTQNGQYPETWAKIRNGIVPSDDAIEVAEGLLDGTIDSGLSENVFWQTGFIPDWNAEVVYVSDWHYYSVVAS